MVQNAPLATEGATFPTHREGADGYRIVFVIIGILVVVSVPEIPVVSGNNRVVTHRASGPQQVYRLFKP